MKRLILLSFGILFSAGIGVALSRYTLAFTDTATITSLIFEQAGISAPTDTTDPKQLKTLAQSAKDPFQNLYLFMYQNVLDGPQKAALKMLSSQYLDGLQFSEDELQSIVLNADTSAIISKRQAQADASQNEDTVQSQTDAKNAADAEFQKFLDDNEGEFSESTLAYLTAAYQVRMAPHVASSDDVTKSNTQDGLLNTYLQVMDSYQKELDLQRDNRKLAYESLASEMFLNNDLTDSANIDLLYDLDLAHYVLFGNMITYPDRSGGDEVQTASIPDSFMEDANSTAEDGLSVELSSEDAVSPYACLDDATLRGALDTFATDGSGATAEAPSTESPITYPDPAEVAQASGATPVNLEVATEAAEKVKQSLEPMQEFLTQLSGTKGDWLRSLPCGDVFCITVKLVDGTTEDVSTKTYADTDNCIACHLSYISKSMTDTTDHSLVAGKISKNWFEDATCKEAGNKVNLDINVYAIKKSIDLNPGDDTADAPANDVQNLKTTLLHVGGFPMKDAPETVLGKTPADIECESLLKLNTLAGSPQSLTDVQSDCKESADTVQEAIKDVFDQSQFEGMMESQSILYQQVSAELYKMAITFRNFQDGLKATYGGYSDPMTSEEKGKQDSAPIPSLLKDKKSCTS